MSRIDEIRARLEHSKSEPLYSIVEPWAEDIAYLLDLLDDLKPHLDVAITAVDKRVTEAQQAVYRYRADEHHKAEMVAIKVLEAQVAARAALEAVKEKLG